MFQVIAMCALIAVAIVPYKLQLLLGLSALAYAAWFASGSSTRPTARKVIRMADSTGRPQPPSASDRFEDAKKAIEAVAAACEAFDGHKGGELATALDACMYDYMRVLARTGEESAAAYGSHLTARDRVRERLGEAYVASNSNAEATIDEARARIETLFSACDDVMHADGKAPPPGPSPSFLPSSMA